MRMHKIFRTLKSSFIVSFLMIIICLAWVTPVKASNNPRLIPFQGRLIDGEGKEIHGLYRITFAIYDKPTGGSPLWSEVHESVSVINGQVNVLLGSMSNLDDPDNNDDPSDAVYFTSPRFLGIKVGEESNQQMVPRQQLVPSFHARTADHAVEADHAKESDHAVKADHALEANNAGTLNGYEINRITPIGLIAPYFGNPDSLPDNWMVCDGSVVNDPESPLNGKALPNLTARFVRGEVDTERNTADSFEEGGNDIHIHSSPPHSHGVTVDGGDHVHSGTTGSSGSHMHNVNPFEIPKCPQRDVACGSCTSRTVDCGPHWITTAITNETGGHTHSFWTTSNGSHAHSASSGQVSVTIQQAYNIPRYVALHYIIRIK